MALEPWIPHDMAEPLFSNLPFADVLVPIDPQAEPRF